MKLKNTSETDQFALKVFEGLKPFTITVNNGADAMYLSMALINSMTGSPEMSNSAMRMLIEHSKLKGINEAVAHFFEQADECEIDYPEFIKPIMILMITHILENKDKIKELVENEKDKE